MADSPDAGPPTTVPHSAVNPATEASVAVLISRRSNLRLSTHSSEGTSKASKSSCARDRYGSCSVACRAGLVFAHPVPNSAANIPDGPGVGEHEPEKSDGQGHHEPAPQGCSVSAAGDEGTEQGAADHQRVLTSGVQEAFQGPHADRIGDTAQKLERPPAQVRWATPSSPSGGAASNSNRTVAGHCDRVLGLDDFSERLAARRRELIWAVGRSTNQCPPQLGSIEDGPLQAARTEVGTGEVCARQIGPSQICVTQIRARQARPDEGGSS